MTEDLLSRSTPTEIGSSVELLHSMLGITSCIPLTNNILFENTKEVNLLKMNFNTIHSQASTGRDADSSVSMLKL